MSLLNNSNAIPTVGGGYNLNNSLRFRSSASAHLSRTNGANGNLKTFTFSCWIKYSNLGGGDLWSSGNTGGGGDAISFRSDNKLNFALSGANKLTTDAVYRDPSAWYHIVLAFDTSQATASNRIKLYVNGEQITSFSTASYPALNTNAVYFNTTTIQYLAEGYSLSLDCYLTEVNFVDGQALTPSDFGEYNEDTGVWQPIKYTGTYGTNGFYLKGRGTDNSGNGNNFTETNFNTTNSALTTYDIMTDVPTLTDEDTANYCVLNPNDKSGGTISNGNLTQTNSAACNTNGTIGFPSTGKFYYEVTFISASGGVIGVGASSAGQGIALEDVTRLYGYSPNGLKYTSIAGTVVGVAYGSTYTAGDIISVAFDSSTRQLTFYKNNVSQGVAFTVDSGYTYLPQFHLNNASINVNFGQRPFAYTPPAGYLKLNTFNLPDSSIVDGSENFNTVLYTGDGAATKDIIGVGFQPDFTWIKVRNNSGSHMLTDAVRGAGLTYLHSNSTEAENSDGSTYGYLDSFDADGFGVTHGANGNWTNRSGWTYAAWNWKAGGTAVSNTDGTIGTSQVSANTTAGFSVGTYSGDGTNANKTVGHGLGVVPEMIIVKSRSEAARNWLIWHKDLNDNDKAFLFNTDAAADNRFGPNAPTTTVFGAYGGQGNRGTSTMVFYAFASVEGYSKIGSYTGNGSADGPFIYTGFKPAFIMFRSTILCNWVIVDSARSTYNVMDDSLYPNTGGTEITTITDVDFLSNGFKWRANLPNETNASGQTYIYMAFAENPFKNSLAR